ncbi:MAG: hypothetical protein K8T90_05535 [Planctomycetes bacterium]|nr:hypothetical protein [Planctomycetota bacterium]
MNASPRFARATGRRGTQIALAVGVTTLLVSSVMTGASAAEGVLPVRPGDTVSGTLLNCYDRQIAEIQLLRGETFRIRLHTTHATNDDVNLRVFDPDGIPASVAANVRQVGGEVVAGPFRASQSGTWRFEIGTLTAHGAQYEARTQIKRTAKRTATVVAGRAGVVIPAAAGSTFTLRGSNTTTVSFRRPEESVAQVFAPDSAEMVALTGAGLSAPVSGNYELGCPAGKGRVKITVTPPRAAAPDAVTFPALPEDAHAVAAWQGSGGWLLDHTRSAPDADGVLPVPEPAAPPTSPWSGSIVEDCPAPGEATDTTLDDAHAFDGPAAGVGMPTAGIPRLDDVVRYARIETSSGVASYVLTRHSDTLGDVTTRVWFTVDGQPSRAPIAIDGRVAVRWTDTGGTQQVQGTWVLAFDAIRGVQVLNGSESRFPDPGRAVTSSAAGFALPVLPGAWPQGTLTTSVTDPRRGDDFTRTEAFTGAASVTVAVRSGATTDSVSHDFPAK